LWALFIQRFLRWCGEALATRLNELWRHGES
jgi:hypothetical protein